MAFTLCHNNRNLKESKMKKFLGWILAPVLALSLMLGAGSAVAAAKSNPVDELTGTVWMQSGEDLKLAFLYGVECAITVEYFVAQKVDEQNSKAGKKKGSKEIIRTLSPFEQGWAKAFEGVSREKIVAMVNDWYAKHPDQMQRPVFSVIWYELIAPKLDVR